jgi:hypothetical protein
VNRKTKTERESQKIDYDEHKNEILYVQVAKLKAEIDNQRNRKVNNKKQKEKSNYEETETEIEIWEFVIQSVYSFFPLHFYSIVPFT